MLLLTGEEDTQSSSDMAESSGIHSLEPASLGKNCKGNHKISWVPRCFYTPLHGPGTTMLLADGPTVKSFIARLKLVLSMLQVQPSFFKHQNAPDAQGTGLELGACKGAAVRMYTESFLRKVFEHETCQGNSPLVSGCVPFPGDHWPRAQCNCDGNGNLRIALVSV
ncbi:uncharacterized protein LOC143695745 [Agelaius phoeniceus]|uniref:uncharacterized protein LOC143695745 n=1 Tax=Agelaius phoeniceus TaxID=39638 RepID=UPI004054C3DA